jgi:hypothetical protein
MPEVVRTSHEARRVTSRLSTCCRQMKDVIMQIADGMKFHTKPPCASWQRKIFFEVA